MPLHVLNLHVPQLKYHGSSADSGHHVIEAMDWITGVSFLFYDGSLVCFEFLGHYGSMQILESKNTSNPIQD